ncbi:helix-turn-helix domain-containing protein [uncultured Megasphaera sp.]|uniref:terminase gpP N-terminus-related DNA-binding protein n=1 Tax=uncultured Megasphaera sp. TaxID=165188 RepID=UPI0034656CCC
MVTWEKAYNDYVKGLKYKEIAKKYDVSVNTVKSWQRRYGWKREKGAHKKTGAPFFNTNAAGESERGDAWAVCQVPARRNEGACRGL